MSKFNEAFVDNKLDKLLTPEEVANILGVSVNTLNNSASAFAAIIVALAAACISGPDG